MNEWLNEKALEASANKPLSIKTESLDMFPASVSSPSTPTHPLSKSSSFATTPVHKTNLDNSMGASLGGSLGSAKKVRDLLIFKQSNQINLFSNMTPMAYRDQAER